MSGGIPLDSRDKAAVHNQSLEKAATFLEATAADYEQMAKQQESDHNGHRSFGSPTPCHQARENREKARLLRGQAGHIREMKVTVK